MCVRCTCHGTLASSHASSCERTPGTSALRCDHGSTPSWWSLPTTKAGCTPSDSAQASPPTRDRRFDAQRLGQGRSGHGAEQTAVACHRARQRPVDGSVVHLTSSVVASPWYGLARTWWGQLLSASSSVWMSRAASVTCGADTRAVPIWVAPAEAGGVGAQELAVENVTTDYQHGVVRQWRPSHPGRFVVCHDPHLREPV